MARKPKDYEAHKERMRERSRERSLEGREIGGIPAVVDPARRAEALASFERFCLAYFPEKFSLALSEDHRAVMLALERAVEVGELNGYAMPRGSGKTTICICGVIYGLLKGTRKFAVLIGAEQQHAIEMLEAVKSELENNDLLAEDFPEVCYPIRMLEGIHQRAKGQTCDGERTHMSWTRNQIVLPTIPGSRASSATVRVAGILGRLRGMSYTRPDGGSVRPDLVLVDDPQTDESARSPSQCEARERLLKGAVLGLAGPGKKIAGLLTVTVIQPDDLADRMLDRKRNPDWQGRRMKLMYGMPTNEALWSQYDALRVAGLQSEAGTIQEATEFYRLNRAAMDEGAKPAWEARFNPDEISAVQYAMNLLFKDSRSFWAEYQNEPQRASSEESSMVTADVLAAKLNRVPRGTVPNEMQRLTCFVDIQESIVYYLVAAWRDDFTGAVVDYGTWPEQARPYFVRRELRKTLKTVAKGQDYEAALTMALNGVGERVLSREWRNEQGTPMRIERCLVDANFSKSTDVVRAFCRRSQWASILWPSHGRGLRAKDRPMIEHQAKAGEKIGRHWKTSTISGQRHVLYDGNWWKTFLSARLQMQLGAAGALSFPGTSPIDHRMIFDHLTAEKPIRVTANGRTIDEWSLNVGSENDYLDCLIGAAVAASMGGVSLTTQSVPQPRRARMRPSNRVQPLKC